jgi:hypothetical protein
MRTPSPAASAMPRQVRRGGGAIGFGAFIGLPLQRSLGSPAQSGGPARQALIRLS